MEAMGSGPTWPGLLGDWELETGAVLALVMAAAVYARGARVVAEPRRSRGGYYGGLTVVGVALLSPVSRYAHDLLSVHMVQHLLLTLVAAPLLVASHPGRALMAGLPMAWQYLARAAGRSRTVAVLTRPLVGWVLFAATGWAVHFSPLFDLALRNPAVHAAEHALFLVTGLLFWWPLAGGATTGRGCRPLAHGLRVVAVALAMPQNTFLALAVHSATSPLYPTYIVARGWGPSPLADQRQAAGVMWVAGDLALLVAVLVVAAAWAADEARRPPEDD